MRGFLFGCLTFTSIFQAEEPIFDFASFQESRFPLLEKEKTKAESALWKINSSDSVKRFARRDKKAVLHGHVLDPSLKWDWGFRNGIKYNRAVEDVFVAGTYTHFHSKSYASLEKDGELMPLWHQVESPQAIELGRSTASSWRLDVDIGDVEIGKTFKVQKILSVRPHIGIRGTCMYQKFDIDYERFERGVLKEPALANNSLGLGTRGGVDSFLTLGKGVFFFGDSALSWLKSYHNIHERHDLNMGMTVMECSLGFQYEKKFEDSLCLFTMKTGYEFNYFFNQERWGNWFSSVGNKLEQERISLEGFSLGFRLDF